MTTRGRKLKPGHITIVGAGPGDPGLLTTRARTVLTHAALVFTDPDVPEAVLALVGTALPPTSGPAEPVKKAGDQAGADSDADDATNGADGAAETLPLSSGVEVRPALGDPAEVAKLLVNEAKAGADVVRLVAGDPLSDDAVITEVNALARAHGQFEIVPGLPPTSAVPTYAGLPLGSSHTVASPTRRRAW
jgi:uroporphyrinogen III methyltransferase/synthase